MSATNYVIRKCTCGREGWDHADLAVIAEEDKIVYKRSAGVASTRSRVVCLRKGCSGSWKTSKKYIDKLPRILNIVYLRQKEKDREDMKSKKIQTFNSHEMDGQTA